MNFLNLVIYDTMWKMIDSDKPASERDYNEIMLLHSFVSEK